MKRTMYTIFLIAFVGCSSPKNSEEFIFAVKGNYLFNAKEIIGISFEESKLQVKWRGKEKLTPLKINDSTFYIKEMNEKFIFVIQDETYIQLMQKREHEGETIRFIKMKKGEKTPNEYLLAKEYEKAYRGYNSILKNNPNNRSVRESNINSLGYRALRRKDNDEAIKLFTLNTKLYPESSNVYDSLGEAYWSVRDTINAMRNYKKALELDPKNSRAKKFIQENKKP